MAKLNKAIQDVIDNTSDVLCREEIYINGVHEYDYYETKADVNTTVHTLYYSDDFEWADDLKKTVAMQLVDTGDGIQIIGVCTRKEIDYLEAEKLHVLLRLSSQRCVFQISEPKSKRDF
jgi:hypothetical protein